eukprot:SAG22_NODE_19901_length_270_cov_1.198830_1_plen_44_part_10
MIAAGGEVQFPTDSSDESSSEGEEDAPEAGAAARMAAVPKRPAP